MDTNGCGSDIKSCHGLSLGALQIPNNTIHESSYSFVSLLSRPSPTFRSSILTFVAIPLILIHLSSRSPVCQPPFHALSLAPSLHLALSLLFVLLHDCQHAQSRQSLFYSPQFRLHCIGCGRRSAEFYVVSARRRSLDQVACSRIELEPDSSQTLPVQVCQCLPQET